MLQKEDNITDNTKKIILFGAGKVGLEALRRYGKDRVAYFCDNSVDKQGQYIDDIKILSFDELLGIYDDNYILVISLEIPYFVIGQLEKNGILDYIPYQHINPRVVIYDECENNKEKMHNNMLRRYVEESSKVDLLEDVSTFQSLVKDVLKESKSNGVLLNYFTRGDEEEGYRYGNLQTLLRFAELDMVEGSYVPVVSHIMSVPIYSPIFEHKTAVFFSGEYYKELIHRRSPWIPIFTIGPYIHYAKGIYDSEKLSEKKKSVGKIVLAVLPHALENAGRSFDKKKFVDTVKKLYGKDYDQMWLCVYFADINDDACKYAQDLGFHIVTAGFRFDPMFNERLKTIIQMSDAVVCGEIGGFLTYSLYYNKPIARVNMSNNETIIDIQYERKAEVDIEKTPDYLQFEKNFYSLFNEELTINESKIEWMDPLGGYKLVKSKDFIRNAFEIAKDIWECSDGNFRKYPSSVREVYYKYNGMCDLDKMYILRQAVGPYVD